MPTDRLPSDWRTALAVLAAAMLGLGWAEVRMGGIAETRVAGVDNRLGNHIAVQREADANASDRIKRIEEATKGIQEDVRALRDDCVRRGGCKQ